MSDHEQFVEEMAAWAEGFADEAENLQAAGAEFVEKHFGPRCPDFEEGCVSCQRWDALDKLTRAA